MIHEMDSHGYLKWIFAFRAELFIPVFKLLLSAVMLVGNGNYNALLFAVFANHMLILFLSGYLMRMWGFTLVATLFV